MIAKLEWTQKFAQQNIEQLQNPTTGVKINNEPTKNRTTAFERTIAKPLGEGGGWNAFYWYQIFDLDSAVVETQKS